MEQQTRIRYCEQSPQASRDGDPPSSRAHTRRPPGATMELCKDPAPAAGSGGAAPALSSVACCDVLVLAREGPVGRRREAQIHPCFGPNERSGAMTDVGTSKMAQLESASSSSSSTRT